MAALLAGGGCRGNDGAFSVSIDAPADGATVQSPVSVQASATGFRLEPAGTVREGAGHLHLLVDAPCDQPGQAGAASPQRLRLEDGRTQATVPLPPGDHTLCLQASDGRHTALAATDTVRFRVAETAAGTAPPTTTPPVVGGSRWTGTSHTDFKAGRYCDPGVNTGDFTFEVSPDNTIKGSGRVSATQYTCRLPEGTSTIPPMTITYTLSGRKEPSVFVLVFSNGPLEVRVPYSAGSGRTEVDHSVGEYLAKGWIAVRCASGCLQGPP